ncbi:VOC family protein [Kitasatospora sp. MMS16-BH015]|uniref:VOC family protein n=1 Tax=Kitasatospora sp. MMS16-BH015 TaxID=2018025 RepID=UPI0020C23B66|nr:VOC family protein [Kitasatospora sp. MMS16-BH015]
MTEIIPGSPCWAQLSVRDVPAALDFYGGLFGWRGEPDPDPQFGGYTIFSYDGAAAAAVAPLMNPQQPVMWLLSIATADIEATSEAAKAAGATLWMGPMDVADRGKWALLNDPTGAPFALWQGGSFAGFGVVNEPNSFGWADLSTRDKDGATAFYAGVFGWRVWPDENYAMVGLGEDMFGGVMKLDPSVPPEVPSHWAPYFLVADVDASAATAARLGGEVLHGPTDVQMENGPRIAVIRDPQGGTFGIFAPR